jgi:hypothetical protein
MGSINLNKIKGILTAMGGFVITCQRNPEGVDRAIKVGLVVVLALAVWRIPPLLA